MNNRIDRTKPSAIPHHSWVGQGSPHASSGWEFHNSEAIAEDDDDKKILTSLLYKVAELTGLYNYDKYGKENLHIFFDKKGHKMSDED